MRFSQQSGDDSGYLSAFNFSSLTDIVMLLLIFFLLTSSFVTTKGLNVLLPDAANIDHQPEEERLFVSIDGEQRISFDDTEITKEQLPGMVTERIAQDTAMIVVLKADENLPYTVVIEMMDLIKGAGANRFFLATDQPKQ